MYNIGTTNTVPPPPSAEQVNRARKVCRTRQVAEGIRLDDFHDDFSGILPRNTYSKFYYSGQVLKERMRLKKSADVSEIYEQPVEEIPNSIHRFIRRLFEAGYAFNPRKAAFCTGVEA